MTQLIQILHNVYGGHTLKKLYICKWIQWFQVSREDVEVDEVVEDHQPWKFSQMWVLIGD